MKRKSTSESIAAPTKSSLDGYSIQLHPWEVHLELPELIPTFSLIVVPVWYREEFKIPKNLADKGI